MGLRPVVVLDVFALATGTHDANRTYGLPSWPRLIHSGPPKLCTRQACHRRSSDKRNAEVSSPAFAVRSGVIALVSASYCLFLSYS